MKLLTLNCHSWMEENQLEKLRALAKDIQEKSYDVIALQEVSQSKKEKLIEGKIRQDNFGYLLLEELYHLNAEEYAMIWDFSHMAYDIYEEGLALLTKHKILKEHTFFASSSEDTNSVKTRKIVGATVDVEGVPMDFYSCHLGWWEDEVEPSRQQFDRLFANIPFNKRTFLMGDFNNDAFVRGKGYDYLISKGLYDTFHLAKEKDEGITVKGKIDGWKENKGDLRIDLILGNEEVEVAASYVIFNGENKTVVSDHYGVAVVLCAV